MNAETQLIAWHGWAFDRTCWEPWRQFFANDWSVNLYDRGYWGAPKNVEFDEEASKTVLFAHSFGLHLCPNSQISSADLVIIFGGFIEFHPVATQFNRRSKLILNKMIQSLQEAPEQVINDFLENTYKPNEKPDFNINGYDGEKLLHDLHTLNQSSIDIEQLKQANKICILHGSADAIVPKTKGREIYNILNDEASYFEVKDAGHALPFTHTEQCWTFIQPELQQVLDDSG